MTENFVALIPNAITVTIGPISIATLILLFFSKKPRINSIVYTLGWILGIVACVVIFAQIFSSSGGSDTRKLFSILIDLLLGLVLIYFGFKEFSKRKKKAGAPSWMKAIDSLSPLKAFAIGFFYSTINSKNTLINISSAAAIGEMAKMSTEMLVDTTAYTLIGSSAFIILTLLFLIFNKKVQKPLIAAKEWLITNNSLILCVIFLLVGAELVIKSILRLWQ